MTELKNIEKLANKFDNDPIKISTELKRIQSIKCRLKKQKFKSSYQEQMTKVIQYEQALKEAKALLEPKEKPVTQYDLNDIKQLDYDETVKAIRNIQSKKTLTKYLTEVAGDNEEYKSACKIESMLIEHRNSLKPVENGYIRKTEIQTIIDTIESNDQLSQERLVELLKKLI